MFRSIVVALDLGPDGDRALPIVRGLAAASDLPVELITVSSPNMDETVDAHELSRRASANGWPPNAFAIAHDNDIARAIVNHLESRHNALLVMATSAKASLTARFLGSITEAVLSRIDQPVLLVGPHVPVDCELVEPTLVVLIDAGDLAEATVPAIVSWARAVGGPQPVLAELSAPSTDEAAAAPTHIDRYVTLLAAEGITASLESVRPDDIEPWLGQVLDHATNPIFVATSVRWTDARARSHSMTRRLVHRSTRPVLVVPARYAPWRLPPSGPTAQPEMPLEAVEELTAPTCWDLLASTRVGRLAVCMSGLPRIFPINFVVDEHTIVFRTAPGTKLSALKNSHVAFEIDDYDPDSGHASSVIVDGRASEITEAADWDHALDLPLFPWHVSPKGHFVRITPENVSGRRFRAVYVGPANDTGRSPS
jgi:nitroimidazol reductase NimA-like FMN-containing flavoprotein (pyridoxamine 5'-phosphate oxidase superfamily)/nucleotide-binding universal stress UspA family protein